MKNQEKTNFTIKLNVFCDNDKTPRKQLQHIYFNEGYAVATDAHILIKHKITENECKNLELLEGNFIHGKQFEKILKYQTIEATATGILATDKEGDTLLFEYANKEDVGVYPHYYTAIPTKTEPVEQITFKAENLQKIISAFKHKYRMKFVFCNTDKAIKVSFEYYEDTTILLMPTINWE